MTRAFNFSAGPAILPEPVLREAQEALWDLNGSGIGVMECSHRSKLFDGVVDAARERLTRLLGLDDDQEVLFLQGGARSQFYMLPMNLLRGGRATYLDTGTWSKGAIDEAHRYGTVDVPFSSRAAGYDRTPEPGEWGPLPEGTVYLHYTSNNTVAGSEFHYIPEVEGDAFLACDASSDFLSRPIDATRFGFLYGGAQKNLGPAGVTLVVIRRSLLDRCDTDIPAMCRYGIHVAKGSMYNTPPTFGIYVIERVTAWIESEGGLEAIARRNRAQADKVYGVIDGGDFYRGKVHRDCRSLMNLTFTTGSAELDADFVKSATANGLIGLKGHSSVGGLRASLYNAQRDEAVDALIAFMNDFAASRG